MNEKQCANCGELNSFDSNFCTNCGSSEFKNIPPHVAARLADGTEGPPSPAVRINASRVILVSVLSGGLYLLYWFYLTWKQLASETHEQHYPVWHALTLSVPVYGLFRMHAHVRVIGEVARRQGITSTMAPGLAVALLLVSSAIGWSSIRITDTAALIVLSIISTVVSATLIVTAQADLNRYWKIRWPDSLTDARVGVGEVVFVILGIILWISLFTSPVYLE